MSLWRPPSFPLRMVGSCIQLCHCNMQVLDLSENPFSSPEHLTSFQSRLQVHQGVGSVFEILPRVEANGASPLFSYIMESVDRPGWKEHIAGPITLHIQICNGVGERYGDHPILSAF